MTVKQQTEQEMIEYLKRTQREYPAKVRLEYYLSEAQKYRNVIKKAKIETQTDGKGSTYKSYEMDVITKLETWVNNAHQAISKGDIDQFALSFEQVIRCTVILNLPEHDKAENSRRQSQNRTGKEGVKSPLTLAMEQICQTIGSTEYGEVFKHWQQYKNFDDAEKDGPSQGPYICVVHLGSEDIDYPTERDFEYWYAESYGNEKLVTLDNIRTTINRIRKREKTAK